jgi:hypothetical protein
MSPIEQWNTLVHQVNGREVLGMVGVRDPEGPCDKFNGKGYDGSGSCHSDGHYLCVECSHLSPDAPRFVEDYGREGRADRLRLFLARPNGPLARARAAKRGG